MRSIRLPVASSLAATVTTRSATPWSRWSTRVGEAKMPSRSAVAAAWGLSVGPGKWRWSSREAAEPYAQTTSCGVRLGPCHVTYCGEEDGPWRV